jgi:glycosyltransferase involved in cell wall biosynthesis
MPAEDSPPRLLAVAHEASQTGAPIVLAGALDWLRDRLEFDLRILLLADGPLRPRFEAIAPTTAVTDVPGLSTLGLIERGLVARGDLRARRIPAAVRLRTALARLGRFDVVYLNSLTTLDLCAHLRGTPRVIAHVHEGPLTIAEWARGNDPMRARHRPDRWIAVGEDTAQALQQHLGVPAAAIEVQHPFIDVAQTRARPQRHEDLDALRRDFGIPGGAGVVVGAGSVERRKGPDLFVQLAVELRRRSGPRPVHFVWVGGDRTGQEWRLLEADLHRTGLTNVHLTGHLADPRPVFQLADVFALTSREDPFPLVCLEAGALGIPVVAYESSGIRTLLTTAGPEAAKGVIPFLDLTTFADRVDQLLTTPSAARTAADELHRAVTTHHDRQIAAPRILASLLPPETTTGLCL